TRARTRSRVSSPMSGWLRRTLEIVMTETPRSRAMSFILVVIEGQEKSGAPAILREACLPIDSDNFIDYSHSLSCKLGTHSVRWPQNSLAPRFSECTGAKGPASCATFVANAMKIAPHCSYSLTKISARHVRHTGAFSTYLDSLMIASAALPATTQLADPATTASSSNQRNPKSSMHSGKSGLMMMYPGITAPGI